MSNKVIDYRILLKRDGQTQKQRMPTWLPPSMAPIDSRTKEEFFTYLKAIASQIKFPDIEKMAENGSWEDFFNLSLGELRELSDKSTLPAHIALWESFIRLYQLPQKLANNITQRHLDFYYGEVLNLKKSEPKPDQAFVLFELKKNTADYLLKEGTYLLAGKDNIKKERRYRLLHDIIVNQSTVAALKSLYVDPKNKNFIHHAPIANSADGLGAELDPTKPKWSAFGNHKMPLAQIGFCLASEVLKMKEGERTVRVDLTLDSGGAFGSTQTVPGLFKANLTGEKGWVGPKTISASISPQSNASSKLSMTLVIGKDEPAIIGYDAAVHGNNFKTSYPILQLLINDEKADFGYRDLAKCYVEDATLEVEVKGIKELQLENDFGALDSKKPFTPFGSTPEVNVNFTVGSEEAFSKRLKEFSFDVEWKNIPADDLGKYFDDYGSGNSNSHFTATAAFKDGYNWGEKSKIIQLFHTSNAQSNTSWSFYNSAFPEKCPVLFLPQVNLAAYAYPGQSFEQKLGSRMAHLIPSFAAFNIKVNFKEAFKTMIQPYKEIRKGKFQLRLRHNFLFKEYRNLYAARVLTYKSGSLSLPNEPFAPEIQSLSLNYTATTAKISFSGKTLNDFVDEEIEFYHHGAFGQKREHAYLKNQHTFLNDPKVRILPEYEEEGSFLIGIDGLVAQDAVCILIKVADGSANPEKTKVEINWSVLCDNYWKPLGTEDFIFDSTNGLISSGVIKIVIPREATITNTLLNEGLVWLKAGIKKDSDAVCDVLDVQTNGAIARFENADNDPYHLSAPLAANTIHKLDPEIGSIKSVKQPFASFGGVMQEDADAFYIRCSERLRHKGRGISNWDYERMILQHFPEIHKVKCINHASRTSFYQPGHLLTVVVPNLLNQNAVDPLKPKTDKNTLENISNFLKTHSSPWVTHHVSNPYYEPVQVSARIKLKIGFEYNYYEKTIDQKLQQYLSPWIGDEKNTLSFGGKITQSMIVQFLEDMEFIDFVSDVWLSHSVDGGSSFAHQKVLVEASSPAAVLVSHTHHYISNF
jgi:hypothetical protein